MRTSFIWGFTSSRKEFAFLGADFLSLRADLILKKMWQVVTKIFTRKKSTNISSQTMAILWEILQRILGRLVLPRYRRQTGRKFCSVRFPYGTGCFSYVRRVWLILAGWLIWNQILNETVYCVQFSVWYVRNVRFHCFMNQRFIVYIHFVISAMKSILYNWRVSKCHN